MFHYILVSKLSRELVRENKSTKNKQMTFLFGINRDRLSNVFSYIMKNDLIIEKYAADESIYSDPVGLKILQRAVRIMIKNYSLTYFVTDLKNVFYDLK